MKYSNYQQENNGPKQQYYQKYKQISPGPGKNAKDNINVYQFKHFNLYTKNNRPTMNKQKQQTIQKKLQIETIAQERANKRIRNQDYFINNPQRYLIQNSFQKYKSIPYNIHDNLKAANKPSFAQKTTKPQQNITQFKIYDEKKEMSLEDIMNMNDKCYYTQQIKDINIFKIMKNKSNPFSRTDLIQKYHFALQSTQYTSKMSIKAEHYISSKIRLLTLGKIKLNSVQVNQIFKGNQLQINPSSIRFIDIINISIGKLNHSLVHDIITNQMPVLDGKISQEEDDDDVMKQIMYKPQAKNFGCRFESEDLDQEDIKKYLKLQLTKEQAKQDRYLKSTLSSIKSDIQIKQALVGDNIKDRLLHNNISKTIDKNIQFIDSKIKNEKNIDKLIRQKKLTKDRYERIRLQKLIEGLRMIKSSKNKYNEFQ